MKILADALAAQSLAPSASASSKALKSSAGRRVSAAPRISDLPGTLIRAPPSAARPARGHRAGSAPPTLFSESGDASTPRISTPAVSAAPAFIPLPSSPQGWIDIGLYQPQPPVSSVSLTGFGLEHAIAMGVADPVLVGRVREAIAAAPQRRQYLDDHSRDVVLFCNNTLILISQKAAPYITEYLDTRAELIASYAQDPGLLLDPRSDWVIAMRHLEQQSWFLSNLQQIWDNVDSLRRFHLSTLGLDEAAAVPRPSLFSAENSNSHSLRERQLGDIRARLTRAGVDHSLRSDGMRQVMAVTQPLIADFLNGVSDRQSAYEGRIDRRLTELRIEISRLERPGMDSLLSFRAHQLINRNARVSAAEYAYEYGVTEGDFADRARNVHVRLLLLYNERGQFRELATVGEAHHVELRRLFGHWMVACTPVPSDILGQAVVPTAAAQARAAPGQVPGAAGLQRQQDPPGPEQPHQQGSPGK